MKRKNLALRVSSCMMAALLTVTTATPAFAAEENMVAEESDSSSEDLVVDEDAYLDASHEASIDLVEDASLDTSALDSLIAKAQTLDETAYTKTSWDSNKSLIDSALVQARTAVRNKYSQANLDDAYTNLEAAMNKLVAAGDTSSLQSTLAEIEALNAENYTCESWYALNNAVTVAKNRIKARVAQLNLNLAQSNVQYYMAKLVESYDLTGLKEIVAKAAALNQSDYTEESWAEANLSAALENANAIIAKRGVQEEVEAATEAVDTAMDQLVKVDSGKEEEEQKKTIVTEPEEASITGLKASYSKTYGDSAFSLGAKADTDLTYKSSNTSVATVDNNGKVTIKAAGTAKITVTSATTEEYTSTSETVTVSVAKANPTIKTSISGKNYSYNALKKKSISFNIGASANSKGTITCKKVSEKSGITVSSAGKVTVKKGMAKGTYKVKVKVSAAAKGNYKAGSKTVTITVKVK